MNDKVLSYHNDPAVKQWHVDQAKHHFEADMLVSGTYGESNAVNFKGCSIGCMAHDIEPRASTDKMHAIVAAHAGWPEWLARLNDFIFEGLPQGEREMFHVKLREAIPVGVDLEPVRHKLALRRIDRLIDLQTKSIGKHGDAIDSVVNQVIAVLQQVRRCHEAEIGGNTCDIEAAESAAWSAESAASAARSAAWSAWSAARSAAESAAWSAARSAAESAARSAESAAESAARSAAWSAWSAARSAESAAWSAESAAWKQEAADLLELLSQA